MAKPIILSDQDRVRLEGMVNDENTVLSKRAKIILACAEGLNNKEVADQLKVDEETVSKWRTAFLNGGIDSLDYVHSGGIPRTNSEQEIDKMVLDAIENLQSELTIKAVAQEAGLTYYHVQRSLKRQDVTFSMKRQWEHHTMDHSVYNRSAVIGIYLSENLSAVVTVKAEWGISLFPGCFRTFNRKIEEDISRSTHYVSLEHLLVTASVRSCIDKKHRGNPISKIIRDYIESLPPYEGLTYHVFSLCDKPPSYSGIMPENTTTVFFDNRRDWLREAHDWIGANSDGRELIHFERTQRAIEKYLDRCSSITEPFVWGRTPMAVGTPETPLCREDEESAAENDVLLDLVRDSIPDECIPAKDDDLSVVMIPMVIDRDRGSYSIIPSDELIPTSSFHFENDAGFLNGVDVAESAIIKLRDKSGIEMLGLVTELVKKKRAGTF